MARRSFTLSDAMILIAAAGIGFWLARMLVDSDAVVVPASPRDAWRAWVGASYLLLLGLTLGVAAVRLRSPGPADAQAPARQPRFLAGVAAASIVALGTALAALDWFTFWGRMPSSQAVVSNWLHGYLLSVGGPWNVGFAVGLSWIIGGLQRFRWRRPDWVEWAGRLLGALWVLFWLVLMALKSLWGL